MSLNQLKRKIQSINSTAKITNAMSLIATTKFKKQRKIYERNREYFKDFFKVIGFLLHEVKENKILEVKNAQDSTLWININSTMGLCGSYNASLDEHAMKNIKKGDIVFQIGKQGIDFWNYQTKIPNPIVQEYDFGEVKVPYTICFKIANIILDYWKEGKINEIKINYMRFINVLTSKPITLNILPFDPKVQEENKINFLDIQNFEFTPKRDELLKSLIPDYVANMIYGALIEAKVSEYALRRTAMDAATKNAEDLSTQYKLQYNNARQAQITTEIVEIISSSNALPKEEEEEYFNSESKEKAIYGE